jgi:hypothetical protein
LEHTPETVIVSPAFTLLGTVVVACMSACAVTLTSMPAVLLALTGSVVEVVAAARTFTVPLAGAVKLTLQVILSLRAREATGDGGAQTTEAPGGSPVTAQLALAASLGPVLVQVTVPLTVLPALALSANPLTAACRSARGVMVRVLAAVLLLGTGSAVLLPAVVVMLSAPLVGALKVLVQVMTAFNARVLAGDGGEQDWVAPAGNPLSAQVAAVALLGPVLVQVPLTVTLCPATALAGTVVAVCMSACATAPIVCWAWLLVATGSAVLDDAVPVTVTPPEAGTTKLTVQAMALLAPRGLAAAGQFTVAPGGSPEGTQLALAAGLGPALVQVTVPLTVVPALAVAGKPLTTTCMSAWGVMARGLLVVLLAGVGSVVLDPAVAVMLSGPLAGAVKVLLQVSHCPAGKLVGVGLGRHDWVAPAGKPLNTQVGASAALGPALAHVPLTVTLCPANALAGAVVLDCMSARAGRTIR